MTSVVWPVVITMAFVFTVLMFVIAAVILEANKL